MRLRILSPLAALAVLTVAACSGSPSDIKTVTTTAATSTVTNTARPSTTAIWDAATARRMYLAYVAPGNKLADQGDELGPNPSKKKLTSYCGKAAASDADLARELAAGHWPMKARKQVDAFVAGLSKQRSGFLRCATATTTQGAYVANRAVYDTVPLSEQVRIALGVPPLK